MAKALGRANALDYEIGALAFSPDWVAGMFMLFRYDAFRAVAGFDARYFLYYEDGKVHAACRAKSPPNDLPITLPLQRQRGCRRSRDSASGYDEKPSGYLRSTRALVVAQKRS